ncbi:acetyl/propionyl/methylcrotonyl-CoA carboxylase subunit alpha [Actinomadura oligospora]|uniref:acetyl/propionyl/methylcrotonyl-CoA carboxylase subunit alpha n=1 Tax=Actinomadura oligospora TaxID=111804 RepID=UPI00068807A9|nr:biotin carboxylase N-terminal domain-containing protein [Actinomadura oligospora]
MIEKLLVANRGEIARRVLRTCRDLGVATVAVFSDADSGAPHVREADEAVRLPGDAPSATYLRADKIIEAAKATGADAVHPGYGFLSENADFARAVLAAGLTWVGPPPAAVAAMGSKIEAKRLMAAAGVPVLPELDPAEVTGADLPILVKASAGGGGRGMRVVRDPAEMVEQVAAAGREAASAFGDATVFCEPLLERARHIEVQILADAHGTVWALGERECSIQRRHQKIVEEAPSPAVRPALRAELCAAAVNAAKAIEYVGAGTVEFMLAPDGRFFFLEVNTRLQVEHPVTECVYGLDLVRLQLEVAEGARLPDEPPAPSGHAIEVRLYAEDPALDWRPASGVLHAFDVPDVDARFTVPGDGGLRLDAGYETGGEVGVHYDPMLAKLIAYAPTRAAAARRLRKALSAARLHGVTTNRDLLVRVLGEKTFLAGDTHTGYLDEIGLATLAEPLADERAVKLSALAAALAGAAANRASARVLGGLPSGWRNLPSQPQRRTYDGGIDVEYRFTRDGLLAGDGIALVDASPERVVLDVDGVRHAFDVRAAGGRVFVDSTLGPLALTPEPRFADPSDLVAPGSLLAPMPGTVVRVEAREGADVTNGQTLLILEAMKMEHRIAAPAAGTVTALNVTQGQQVEAGSVLAVISDPATTSTAAPAVISEGTPDK